MHRRTLRFLALLLGFSAAGALAAQVPRPSPEFAINLPGGGQALLSQHQGKVVALAFILTTCPHCQTTTQLLSKLQREYGPRGFQVLETAFNDMAGMLVPDFIARFKPAFPLGYNNREAVMEYLQISPMFRTYVPLIVFVDRKGVIRAQHGGEEDFFKEGAVEKNMRAIIEKLLAEDAASKSGPRRPSRKKAS
ncbi:MAG: TlpA family protein disulfide reductase [Bryobacterales bacterium]|nr:TlpA family protein disulfide reductase [Bryobacterales bacterium]